MYVPFPFFSGSILSKGKFNLLNVRTIISSLEMFFSKLLISYTPTKLSIKDSFLFLSPSLSSFFWTKTKQNQHPPVALWICLNLPKQSWLPESIISCVPQVYNDPPLTNKHIRYGFCFCFFCHYYLPSSPTKIFHVKCIWQSIDNQPNIKKMYCIHPNNDLFEDSFRYVGKTFQPLQWISVVSNKQK